MTEKTAAEYTRLQMARVLLPLRQCPTSAPRAKCCQNSQKINTPRMDVNRKTICIIHSSSCQSSIQTWLQHWNWNLCLNGHALMPHTLTEWWYINLITGYLQGSYSSSKAKFHDFSSQSHNIPWPIVPHISVKIISVCGFYHLQLFCTWIFNFPFHPCTSCTVWSLAKYQLFVQSLAHFLSKDVQL